MLNKTGYPLGQSRFLSGKKFILLILVFIIHYSLFINHCKSQWGSDIRLTNNSGNSRTSYNNAWCVASNGNIVHAAWYDDRDGNNEIYYKRSSDGGINWGEDTRLTFYPSVSWYPCISLSGSTVHIVWDDQRDGNREIYYKRSTDNGITWESDVRLTNDTAVSRYVSMSVSGLEVHIVWEEYRDGNAEIYYKLSTDGGVSWGTDTRLTYDPANSRYPSIAFSGSVVHVSWEEYRDGTYSEIYYKRSTNEGVTWGTDKRLTNDPSLSLVPSIAASGSNVYVGWCDFRDGNYEVYFKYSTDAGINWGVDTRLTNYTGLSGSPSISISGLVVHLVWYDQRDGNAEIYYKRSTNGGVTWELDTRLTNDPGTSWYTSVSVTGSVVHVLWCDNRDGNYEIYYKRNPTGNPIGIKNISTEIPKEFKLEQNYPNPFNPTTKINFDLPKSNLTLSEAKGLFVQLKVFDITGKEVVTLINEQLHPGTYEVTFDARNLSSGIYFYKLVTSVYSETKSMILFK
jgi:hypothetical protein